MKFYRVKEEYVPCWGDSSEVVVSESEIKRLSAEWGLTIKSLKEELEEIKHEKVTIERYYVGDHVIEVEKKNDYRGRELYEFWICGNGYGMKAHHIGWYTDQTQAKIDPKVYTKEEVLDLILNQIGEGIDFYDEEMDTIEEAFCEKMSGCEREE